MPSDTNLAPTLVARGLRFPEGPVAMEDGSVLLVDIARGTLSRVQPDGTIEVVAELGGGSNGVAIGPDGAAYVCNNGGASPGTSRTARSFPATPRPVTRAARSSASTSTAAA